MAEQRRETVGAGCCDPLPHALNMALPELATAAADLLQWLDVTGTTQVLEHVGGCLCAGGQPTSGAAVPVALQVDCKPCYQKTEPAPHADLPGMLQTSESM